MTHVGRIAIRVDADAEIGLGHVTRMLILARRLVADGFEIRFVSRHRPRALVEELVLPFQFTWLNAESSSHAARSDELWDAHAMLERLGPWLEGRGWALVDSYELGERWERTVRAAGLCVLAIDDFRNRRHCADILVSDMSDAFDPSLNSCPRVVRALVGAQYALVGDEFAPDVARRGTGAGPVRVFIAYGGADPTRETAKALDAVRMIRGGSLAQRLGRVDVAVGQVNTEWDAIGTQASGINDVHVHRAPKTYARLLRDADVFLCAGGNAMIEALTVGRLCVVTTVADNQARIVGEMTERRAIVSLGHHASVSSTDVARAIENVLQRRVEVVETPIFDCMGAARIVDAIRAQSAAA